MSSFFGLNYLGTPGGLKANLVKELNVSSFTNDEFAAAFQKFSKGTGVVGSEQIRGVFAAVYGGVPCESEVSSFLSYFDLKNGDGVIDFEHFCYAIDKLREIQGKKPEDVSTEFESFVKFKTAKIKHQRYEHEPQDKFRTPVTASQEIGWYARSKTKVDYKAVDFAKTHCPETIYADEMVRNGTII